MTSGPLLIEVLNFLRQQKATRDNIRIETVIYIFCILLTFLIITVDPSVWFSVSLALQISCVKQGLDPDRYQRPDPFVSMTSLYHHAESLMILSLVR